MEEAVDNPNREAQLEAEPKRLRASCAIDVDDDSEDDAWITHPTRAAARAARTAVTQVLRTAHRVPSVKAQKLPAAFGTWRQFHNAVQKHDLKALKSSVLSCATDENLWVLRFGHTTQARTPLCHVCAHASSHRFFEAAAKLLLDACPEAVKSGDSAGMAPLHYAAARCQPGLCRLILASQPSGTDTACAHLVKAKVIHRKGTPGDHAGKTCLHLAAEGGCVDTVSTLIEAGAAVNDSTASGLTPLHLAVRARNVDIVSVLLASGATLAADHAGYTPLHWIVDDTSDIDAVNESMTPGEAAKELEQRQAVQLAILEQLAENFGEACVNQRCKGGATALEWCVIIEDDKLAPLAGAFCLAGADPHLKMVTTGCSPIDFADQHGLAAMARAMARGWTMWSIKNGRAESGRTAGGRVVLALTPKEFEHLTLSYACPTDRSLEPLHTIDYAQHCAHGQLQLRSPQLEATKKRMQSQYRGAEITIEHPWHFTYGNTKDGREHVRHFTKQLRQYFGRKPEIEGATRSRLRNVAVERVSDKDVRLKHGMKHNESRAIATADIAYRTIIGPFLGYITTEKEFDLRFAGSWLSRLQHNMFSYQLKSETIEVDGDGVVIDPVDAGNESAAINDAIVRDGKSKKRLLKGAHSYNVDFLEVKHKGWPYLFLVAQRDIKKGDELFLDYGTGHWDQVELLREQNCDLTAHWQADAAKSLRTKLAKVSDHDNTFEEGLTEDDDFVVDCNIGERKKGKGQTKRKQMAQANAKQTEKTNAKDKGSRNKQTVTVQCQQPVNFSPKSNTPKVEPSWRFCDAKTLAKCRAELASAPKGSVVGAKVKSEFVVQVGEQENASANQSKRKRVSNQNIWFGGVIVADHGNERYDVLFEGENGAKSEIWMNMKLGQHFVYANGKTSGNLCEKSKRIKNGGGGSGQCKLFAL